MSNIPSSKDELELGHHIVHYTFLPMVVLVFATIVLSFPAWWFGWIPYRTAFLIPWLSLLVACLYIGCLGHYVIPRETYRKVRSGEWGEP